MTGEETSRASGTIRLNQVKVTPGTEKDSVTINPIQAVQEEHNGHEQSENEEKMA